MDSVKERRSNALHKSIALVFSLVFHIALFGGIYYVMDHSSEEKIEVMDENKQEQTSQKKQTRS